MGEFKENVKGATNEAVGNTKQVIGDVTNNPELDNEGKRQEDKGEAQYIKGDLDDAKGNEF
jgi:uncharacterized protein YjbJ (UPF0337 family)